MATTKSINCPSCRSSVFSDQALIAWLSGKSPNPMSCPICGELVPELRWKNSKDRPSSEIMAL